LDESVEDKAKIQNEIKEKDKIISEKAQNIEELKEKIKKLKKIIKIYWFM
jgi:cell division protein FtsL